MQYNLKSMCFGYVSLLYQWGSRFGKKTAGKAMFPTSQALEAGDVPLPLYFIWALLALGLLILGSIFLGKMIPLIALVSFICLAFLWGTLVETVFDGENSLRNGLKTLLIIALVLLLGAVVTSLIIRGLDFWIRGCCFM